MLCLGHFWYLGYSGEKNKNKPKTIFLFVRLILGIKTSKHINGFFLVVKSKLEKTL